MSRAYLLLGSNMGDRELFLGRARQMICAKIGTAAAVSSVYITQPWGFSDETPFLNQLIIAETSLKPEQVMKRILEIEKALGRARRGKQYVARTADIDILFYDDMVVKRKDLVIPHPRLHNRRFALEPLAEVAPELVHPVFNKSALQLLAECRDDLKVEKIAGRQLITG